MPPPGPGRGKKGFCLVVEELASQWIGVATREVLELWGQEGDEEVEQEADQGHSQAGEGYIAHDGGELGLGEGMNR